MQVQKNFNFLFSQLDLLALTKNHCKQQIVILMEFDSTVLFLRKVFLVALIYCAITHNGIC